MQSCLFVEMPIEIAIAQCLFVRLCGIDFKYSIVDSGTGRELQNQPIHNIAGLGEATGERPFRPLAKPMLFMPRSTIRIEVEEIRKGDFAYELTQRGANSSSCCTATRCWAMGRDAMNVSHLCEVPRDTGYPNVCRSAAFPWMPVTLMSPASNPRRLIAVMKSRSPGTS